MAAGQIILAADVTHQANDVHQLSPMIAKTLAMMEAVAGEEVALGTGLFDAGYWSEDNAATETAECEYLIGDHQGLETAQGRCATPRRQGAGCPRA